MPWILFLRTKARVAWQVVLYFSNRASICSHALIILSPSRWFVMTCRVQASVYSPFKHVSNVDPCLRTRISFQHCVSNTFGFRFRVWVHASVPDPYLCTRIRFQPCSNAFDFGCLFVYPPAHTRTHDGHHDQWSCCCRGYGSDSEKSCALAILLGLLSDLLIGFAAEYYTSSSYILVREIAKPRSCRGPRVSPMA